MINLPPNNQIILFIKKILNLVVATLSAYKANIQASTILKVYF